MTVHDIPKMSQIGVNPASWLYLDYTYHLRHCICEVKRPRETKTQIDYPPQNMTQWLLIHDESFLLFSRIFASNSGKRIKSTKPILFKKRDKITKSLKMKNWSSNCKSWRHHRNTDYVIIITSSKKPTFLKRNKMTNRLFKKVEWPYWELPPPGQV